MKNPNNSDSYDITANIREGDPLLAEILRDCYETIASREQDGNLTIFENGLKGVIELATLDKEQVVERQSEGILNAFNRLLAKKKENSLVQSEQEIFDRIQGLFYIKIFSEEGDISQQIGDYAESIMRLDYSQKLPNFSVEGVGKNLFNYFGFALESISESMSFATFSKKSVNAYFETESNVAMVVTDSNYNIRSINNTGELLFETEHFEIEGKSLKTLIPELDPEQILAFGNKNCLKEPLLLNTEKYGLQKVELSYLACDSEDELPEFVFILNFNNSSFNAIANAHENYSIVSNVIGGLKNLRATSQDENCAQSTSIMLENLHKLKESLGAELLNENQLKNLSEVIDFNLMVKQLIDEVQYLIDLDQVNLTITNKTVIPFSANYSTLFSIIKNLVLNAIYFQDRNKNNATVSIEIEDKNEFISINVTDNGIGIDNNLFETIFEKGFTTSQSSNNFGLGLYFTKQKLAYLNGDIHVESTPLKGTTFNILLPRKHMLSAF
ncbi:MAG: hypothetical protein GQ574_14545 [Crocinitomix sp.]|nr:hypothetical protein [Crocinitomix sp.]